MSKFLRTVSPFAMQSGIAANNIVKENDHGLWMRREKVHGFGGYGAAKLSTTPRVAATDDKLAGNRRQGHRREAGDGSADPADGAEDGLTP